jgi:hypothetical protein
MTALKYLMLLKDKQLKRRRSISYMSIIHYSVAQYTKKLTCSRTRNIRSRGRLVKILV